MSRDDLRRELSEGEGRLTRAEIGIPLNWSPDP
jgi:hypothetical protein